MKGISHTLWILVAAIVILIVAVVLIGIFTGGLKNFLDIFNPWAKYTIYEQICKERCSSYCALHPEQSGPVAWTQININSEDPDAPKNCGDIPTFKDSSCLCKTALPGR